MARKKDTELTKVVHLRVSEATKAWYEDYAKVLGISEAATERLALALFIRRGGVAYAKKED